MAFNWIDYVLLAVFLISVLGGLVRGGVREVVSLITWIAAFIIAGLFAKPLATAFSSSDSAQSAISSASTNALNTLSTSGHVSLFALGASFLALFLGTIIVGSLIGYFANRVVEGAGISFFNRLLGAVFGLARGFLVNLLIVFIVQLSPIAQQTYWTQSSLVPSFQPMVEWLGNRVQPGLESLKSRVGQTLENITTGAEDSLNNNLNDNKQQQPQR